MYIVFDHQNSNIAWQVHNKPCLWAIIRQKWVYKYWCIRIIKILHFVCLLIILTKFLLFFRKFLSVNANLWLNANDCSILCLNPCNVDEVMRFNLKVPRSHSESFGNFWSFRPRAVTAARSAYRRVKLCFSPHYFNHLVSRLVPY